MPKNLAKISLKNFQFGFTHALTTPRDFSAQPSEIHAIIGPNGAGKTCLLHTLAGFLPALAAKNTEISGTIRLATNTAPGLDRLRPSEILRTLNFSHTIPQNQNLKKKSTNVWNSNATFTPQKTREKTFENSLENSPKIPTQNSPDENFQNSLDEIFQKTFSNPQNPEKNPEKSSDKNAENPEKKFQKTTAQISAEKCRQNSDQNRDENLQKNPEKKSENADEIFSQKIAALLDARQIPDHIFKKLSFGQQKKTLLLASLAHDPEILLRDEPFTGLDQPTQQFLTEQISRLKNSGKILIFSAHHADPIRARIPTTTRFFHDHALISQNEFPSTKNQTFFDRNTNFQ